MTPAGAAPVPTSGCGDLCDDPADTITVEVWVKADAWAGRATNLRKSGSFIPYNYSGGYSWYTDGPGCRLQHDVAARR